MAKQTAAWGIDIGQCSLKALRCVPSPDGDGVVADAFDFIEYPKILSQPDAEPEVLIREALQQFLSRNELRGDKIAISVSGQAGLTRFFQPPPVDAKTLPDIVKYEAKQQIPFQLEDVIWDFQQIGGSEVDGLLVDAEVGIFAMKREAVFKALKPFTENELEIDVIQLAPLSIYNLVLHEVLRDVPPQEEIDPSNPPESLVVLSMGTDTTDLVITDGIHLWQRNIPVGGNHFTKQLARELKLTYAKAEHLKRNARKAEDPKTIFQAMKPVFNDLVTELQRSLSFFQGNHKKARLGKIMMFGNAAKLPGLRQFLSTSLSTDIRKLDHYEHLGGTAVTSSKQFEENNLSYAVCYGLCLQALGRSKLQTNLLPREFVTERMIRAKKPWALAGVGALLLGCSINYFLSYLALWNVHPEKEIGGESWKSARDKASRVVTVAGQFKDDDKKKVTELEKVRQVQAEIAGSTEGRMLWPELYSAVYQARPRDPRIVPGTPVDPKVVPYAGRAEIYIDSVETVYMPDLTTWLDDSVKDNYIRFLDQQRRAELGLPPAPEPEPAAEGAAPAEGEAAPAEVDPAAAQAEGAAPAAPEAQPAATETPAAAASDTPTPEGQKSLEDIRKEMKLEGSGWVVQVKGHHYFNHDEARQLGLGAGTFVRNTFLRYLDQGLVVLPIPAELQAEFGLTETQMTVPFADLGVKYPILFAEGRPNYQYTVLNPDHPSFAGGMSGGASGGMSSGGPSGVPGAGSGPGASLGLGGFGSRPGGAGSGGAAAGSGGTASGEGGAAEGGDQPISFPAPRYDFTIQFSWQPVTARQRVEILVERAKQANSGAPASPVSP